MKTLIRKDLRENLKLALIGLGLFALLLYHGYESSQNLLDQLQQGYIASLYEGLQPLLARTLLLEVAAFCGLFGAVLGWAQTRNEAHRDLWAFLIHRPVTRTEIFLAKTAAGLTLYTGALGLPLALFVAVVRWPGHVPAGRVDDRTVLAGTDLFPSLCAIAGVPLPTGFAFDGEDLSAALTGTPTVRAKPLFWEYGRNTNSFAYPKGADRSSNVAVREGDWKLLINADGSDLQLFNLRDDPKESANVADRHPDIARRLQDKALAWRKALPKLTPVARPTARPEGAVELPRAKK